VAGRARRWISRRDVIRYAAAQCGGALPSRGVAAITIRVCRGEAVIVVDVARATRRRNVCAGQRPARGAMVKFAVGPFRDRMAHSARRRGLWETGLDVVRHISSISRCAVPGVEMATDAIGRVQGVVVADMARGTRRRRRRHVRADQSEAGDTVIERGHIPARRGMAVGTVGRGEARTGGGVRRVIGLLPVRKMTARISAVGGGNLQIVVVVEVAGRARYVGVTGGERKTHGGMVKFRG